METTVTTMSNNNVEDEQFIRQAVAEKPSRRDLFFWKHISLKPLSAEFIRQFAEDLNWDVMSQHQPFALDIVNEYGNRINYANMVRNKNLNPDVLVAKLDRMDWEGVQTHQKLSPAFLMQHADRLDFNIVVETQKLPEDLIWYFINSVPREQVTAVVAALLRKQKLSEESLEKLILMIGQQNNKLFMNEMLTHQKVSEAFLDKYADESHYTIIATCQTLSEDYINRHFRQHPRFRELANFLLKHQHFSEAYLAEVFLPLAMEAVPDFVPLVKLLDKQNFSMNFLQDIMQRLRTNERLQLTDERISTAYAHICRMVFARTLHPPSHPDYLNWSTEEVAQILPHINWVTIANTEFQEGDIPQLVRNYGDKLPWYLFIKRNMLTEAQIEECHRAGLLNPIVWWAVLSLPRPKGKELSEDFQHKYNERKMWWKFMPAGEIKRFYAACMEVITIGEQFDRQLSEQNVERQNLRTFLADFVQRCDWSHILRFEKLEEWFIRIFSHYARQISMFWWKICRYQKLSETFIQEFISDIDLHTVLEWQSLSIAFLEGVVPFFEKDDWDKVLKNQNLTAEFLQKYRELIPSEYASSIPQLTKAEIIDHPMQTTQAAESPLAVPAAIDTPLPVRDTEQDTPRSSVDELTTEQMEKMSLLH